MTPISSAISRVRAWVEHRPLVINMAVPVLVGALSILDVHTADGLTAERSPDLAAYLLIAAGSIALGWRRKAPELVLITVTAVLIVVWSREYGAFFSTMGLAALYAVAAHADNRSRAWITNGLATTALFVVASQTVLEDQDGFSYANAANMSFFLGGSMVVGTLVRNRQRVFIDTERRAEQAEADRLAEAQRAVARERNRIAREMHDVVAHGMSVIAVQAAAAQEIAHTNPDKTVEVLAQIENVGRESLTEMRRMLGVLRSGGDEDAGLAPQPTLGDVTTAVAQSVESGVATELEITGSRRDLPAGVELAAFRIVQEALTNVLKHAGQSASARVVVDYRADSVAILVSDDGRGAVSSLAESGGGNGLIGMRERVDIYRGEFSAGPRPGGGYAVTAILPTSDAAIRPGITSAAAAHTPNHEVPR
jgi:signal transduction histidine kinase